MPRRRAQSRVGGLAQRIYRRCQRQTLVDPSIFVCEGCFGSLLLTFDGSAMKQRHFTTLLVLLGVLIGGCSLSEKLALRLKAGEQYRQKVTLVSSLNMFLPDIDHREVEMILAHHVEQVDEAGVATMRVSIESIKSSMRSIAIKCKYDSLDQTKEAEEASEAKASEEKAAANLSHQEKYERSFAGLAKTGYRVRINEQGQILEVFDIDPRIASYGTGPVQDTNFGGAELALLFSPHNLREYVLPEVLRKLDAEALEADGRWTTVGVVRGPVTVAATAQKTVRFDAIEKTAAGQVARLKVDVTPSEDSSLPDYVLAGSEEGLTFEIVGSTVKGAATPKDPDDLAGEIVFAVEGGYLVSAEEKYSAEIRMRGGTVRKAAVRNPKRKKMSCVISTSIERLEP